MKEDTILKVMNAALDEKLLAKGKKLLDTEKEIGDAKLILREVRNETSIILNIEKLKSSLRLSAMSLVLAKLRVRFPHMLFDRDTFRHKNVRVTFRGISYVVTGMETDYEANLGNYYVSEKDELDGTTISEVQTRIKDVLEFLNTELECVFHGLYNDEYLCTHMNEVMLELGSMNLPTEGE